MTLDERLERLAHSLRAQGVIHGPERDLMVDAAALIRDLRTMTITSWTGPSLDEPSPTELQIRARAHEKEQS